MSLALCIMVGASALPARATSVPGVPGLNVTSQNDTTNSPAAIVSYQWHTSNQGTPGTSYLQCVNFRILSRKAVSAIKFTIFFEDQFGNTHSSWVTERDGFFGSGTLSRNVCFDVPTNRLDTSSSNITKLVLATTGVRFSDGSVWSRGQRFDQAYLPNGNRFTGTSTVARVPLNVAQNWADLGRSPVEVVTSSTGYDFADTRPRQCVSFLNVSGKTATDVDFSFVYTDASNAPLVTQTHDFSGTFTPPVEIDDKCVYVNLGANNTATRISHVDVHVTRVVFEDGSQWGSGQGFMRDYGNNGARLSSMVNVPPSNPFSAPTVVGGTSGIPVYQPYTPTYAPSVQPGYMPAGQPYVPAPVSQPYVPPASYNPVPQYAPTQTTQLPYALVGMAISNGNAVDRIVPIYAAIGAGFVLQQSIFGQAVGGTGGTQTIYQPPGFVLTGLDVYRGVYGGVDEVLGMKLYWNRLTPSGIDPNQGETSTVMQSSYPQTFPMKVLRASPGTYISNLIITPSTHSDGRTFVHDVDISVSAI